MGKIDAPSSSPSLLQAVRHRDPESWRRLTAIYGPLVFEWGTRRGLQSADAADVLQQVFTSVAQSIDQARWDRPGDSFRGWLWTIFHSRLMDFYSDRRRQPQPLDGGDLHNLAAGEVPATLSSADDNENVQLVRRTLKIIRVDFSQSTWQAFWRSSVDGHATSDIARDLGLSPAAVCMARARVLRRLRETLVELGIQIPNLP